jgi:hypothetical protein
MASLTCADYDVYVAQRGGEVLTCRLGAAISLRYNRTLNDFSESTCEVAVNSSCSSCLAAINPWQHELLIFRAKTLVWCGPIISLTYKQSANRVTIYARDLMAWTEKRLVSPASVDGYEVEEVDIAQVFDWVLRHAYDKDPWNMAWGVTNTGVPISKYYPGYDPVTERWGGSYPVAGAELRSLSQAGIDYTCVNRTLYAGDLVVTPPNPVTLKIADQNWARSPDIQVNGAQMSTRTGVAGGSGGYFGWYDDQIWFEESTHPWGLLETMTPRPEIDEADTTILPNAITQEAAARHSILREPVATISGGQLSGNAQFNFNDLIPGLPIEIGFAQPMRNLLTQYRMYSVNVDVSKDSEEINLAVSTPGLDDPVRAPLTPPVIWTPPPVQPGGVIIVVPPPPPVIEPPPPSSGMTTDIPSGWKQMIQEDFNIDCAEGQFASVYGPRRIKFYPTGYRDTFNRGDYTGAYISVANGVCRQRLFVRNGRGVVSALVPIANPNGGQPWGSVNSMIFEERVKWTFSSLAANRAGFKAAHLMWPQLQNNLTYGEIDWPELDASSGNPTEVKGYIHRINATSGGDQTVATPVPDISPTVWHTYRTVWVSGQYVDFYCDGVLILHSTNRVPNTPFRLALQNETSMANNDPLDPNATCFVDTDWIRVLIPVGA